MRIIWQCNAGSPTSPRAPRQFQSIQYLRALAALGVVIVHTSPAEHPFMTGNAGVDIFFVISGFIMWSITEERPTSPAAFHEGPPDPDRAAVLAAHHAAGGGGACRAEAASQPENRPAICRRLLFVRADEASGLHRRRSDLARAGSGMDAQLRNVFLRPVFPLPVPQAVAQVGRDLAHFALLRDGRACSTAAATHSCCRSRTRYFSSSWPAFCWVFASGEACCLREAWGYGFIALGVIVLLGCALTSVTQPRLLAWGIPAVLLVGGALVVETTGRIPQLPWLRLIGDSSYSLYLTHGLAISVLGKIMTRSWLFSVVGTLAAVGVGICFWYLMERRATAFLKRSLASPRADRYGPQALSSGI